MSRSRAIRTAARLVRGGLAGGLLVASPSFAAPSPGHAVLVPGGLAPLLEVAGLAPRLEPDAALVALLRRLHRGHADRPAPLPECLAHLSAAAADPRPAGGAGRDTVWLPLSAELWDAAIFRRAVAPRERLAALLGDRAASRLALGLLGLDPPTLAVLASDPEALGALRQEGAEAFALFGPAFRVHDGAVEVPGGPEGRALFESLTGCRRGSPSRFLVCLMGAREGRVAWLYDTLAGLDEPWLRFALGLAEPDPERRAERRSALARAFLDAEPFWRPDRAGVRTFPDAAWVLGRAPVDATGRLVGGLSSEEWMSVLDGDPFPGGGDGTPDAAWLVGAVARPVSLGGVERLERLRFAGRVLAANPGLPFARLAPVARGYARAPALFLMLERQDLLEAETLLRAARAVERWSRPNAGEEASAAIEQLQGLLALLDVAARARELPSGAAAELCRTLLDVPEAGGGHAGRLAEWLERTLVARLHEADPESRDLGAEATLSRTLAGVRAAEIVSWDGLRYLVDLPAAWHARFRQARTRQDGISLDEALRAVGAARAAESRRALESADAMLAHVLRDMAYAAAAATLEDTGLARLSTRHQLAPAWALPELQLGGGWRVRGSLLALESAFARAGLHRLDDAPPLAPPVLEPRERETLALTAVQMQPQALTAAARDALATALRRGRERAAAIGTAEVDAAGRSLGLDPWRREAWRRSIASGGGAPFLTLSELAALGGVPRPACDAWGASALLTGGGLCLVPARLEPWSAIAGFADQGLKAAGVPDLALRIVEELAEGGLPPVLAAPIVARTAPDAIDLARPADNADGLALARVAAGLGRPRIHDAIRSLAATGALVPLADPDELADTEATP